MKAMHVSKTENVSEEDNIEGKFLFSPFLFMTGSGSTSRKKEEEIFPLNLHWKFF